MTDTTPMRERLIQAAHKSLGHKQEFRHCTASYQSDIRTIVDAMLSELERPSEAMCDAAYKLIDHGAFVTRDSAIRASIAAMVKAILGGA